MTTQLEVMCVPVIRDIMARGSCAMYVPAPSRVVCICSWVLSTHHQFEQDVDECAAHSHDCDVSPILICVRLLSASLIRVDVNRTRRTARTTMEPTRASVPTLVLSLFLASKTACRSHPSFVVRIKTSARQAKTIAL